MKRFLLFFAFLLLGWFAAPQLRRAEEVATPKAASPQAPAPTPKVTAKELSPIPEVLLQARGAELFTALFDENILDGVSFRELEPALSARFRRPYPREEREAHRELVSRMGILKAMHRHFSEVSAAPERAELFSFYRNLALRPRENLLVKRQAVRNIGAWLKFFPGKKRNELVARLPAAALASAGLTEGELLEEVLRAH